MSPPWMPLYIADYLADTAHLSAAQSGAYLHLIMHYWQRGRLPIDDHSLARIARMDEQSWCNARPTLIEFFCEGWRHKRIDEELEKAKASYERRSSAARKRWNRCSSNDDAKHNALHEQSQPQDIIDPNGSIANLRFERDKKKLAEEREKLRALGDAWNSLAAELRLPQIEEIEPGSARERSALARIREDRDFNRVFAKIRASPFLRGDRGSTPCSFNWITNLTNYQKIVEGNYDEIRQAQRR